MIREIEAHGRKESIPQKRALKQVRLREEQILLGVALVNQLHPNPSSPVLAIALRCSWNEVVSWFSSLVKKGWPSITSGLIPLHVHRGSSWMLAKTQYHSLRNMVDGKAISDFILGYCCGISGRVSLSLNDVTI